MTETENYFCLTIQAKPPDCLLKVDLALVMKTSWVALRHKSLNCLHALICALFFDFMSCKTKVQFWSSDQGEQD